MLYASWSQILIHYPTNTVGASSDLMDLAGATNTCPEMPLTRRGFPAPPSHTHISHMTAAMCLGIYRRCHLFRQFEYKPNPRANGLYFSFKTVPYVNLKSSIMLRTHFPTMIFIQKTNYPVYESDCASKKWTKIVPKSVANRSNFTPSRHLNPLDLDAESCCSGVYTATGCKNGESESGVATFYLLHMGCLLSARGWQPFVVADTRSCFHLKWA